MTIVFTTHYLEEADQAADRIVIIDHGRIIADGTPTLLKQQHVGDRMTLDTPDLASAERLRSLLATTDGVHAAAQGSTVTAQVSDVRLACPAAIATALTHAITVRGEDTKLPTLDDVLLELTGRSLCDICEVTDGELDNTESNADVKESSR